MQLIAGRGLDAPRRSDAQEYWMEPSYILVSDGRTASALDFDRTGHQTLIRARWACWLAGCWDAVLGVSSTFYNTDRRAHDPRPTTHSFPLSADFLCGCQSVSRDVPASLFEDRETPGRDDMMMSPSGKTAAHPKSYCPLQQVRADPIPGSNT